MSRGTEHRLALPLPGHASAIPHSAFIISADALAADEDIAILASSHRGARHPWAFWLSGPNEYLLLNPSNLPFDCNRPIGIEQAYAVPSSTLPQAVGQLSLPALAGPGATHGFGADSAIRVQFALPGYAAELSKVGMLDDFSQFVSLPQYTVWETTEGEWACLVSNSKHNHHARHVQMLPIGAEEPGAVWPVHLPDFSLTHGQRLFVFPDMQARQRAGATEALSRQIGKLSSSDATLVQSLLARMLGV